MKKGDLVFSRVPEEFLGKSVIALAYNDYSDRILFRLDDDTVISVDLDYGYYDDDPELVFNNSSYIGDKELRDLGFITEAEYRRRYDDQQRELRKSRDDDAYQNYLRLKRRFESD